MSINNKLKKPFARASKLKQTKNYLPSGKWDHLWEERKLRNGLKRFKREALGFFGRKTIKSLDEIVDLLHKIGAVSSLEEGKELVPSLDGLDTHYGEELCSELKVDKVYDCKGDTKYRLVAKHTYIIGGWGM